MDENTVFHNQTYSPHLPAAEDALCYKGSDRPQGVPPDLNDWSGYCSLGHSPNAEDIEGEIDGDEAEAQEPAPRPKRKRENRYKNAPPSVISRRRAQNRASQRAYRDRKETLIKDLEASRETERENYALLNTQYNNLKGENDILKTENEILKAENEILKGRLQNPMIMSPHHIETIKNQQEMADWEHDNMYPTWHGGLVIQPTTEYFSTNSPISYDGQHFLNPQIGQGQNYDLRVQ
ncbi:hypothetical protein GGS24DRAFT_464523 [Hypoxylon argillaceum]|nr:hypothetical protein GGS24DRAFT_464523 [Hypoxylon argillaceum]